MGGGQKGHWAQTPDLEGTTIMLSLNLRTKSWSNYVK
jgi:hypothetical protein